MNETNLSPSSELSVALVRYQPDETLALHLHDTASVAVVLAGRVRESVGTAQADHGIGGLAIKPAGIEHHNRFGPSGALMLAIKGDVAARDWCWRSGNRFARLGIGAAAHLAAGDPLGLAHEAAHHLLAVVGDGELRRPNATAAPWLARIRDQVAASSGRPPLVALARSAGVHPVYLTRAFRRVYGGSIGEFVRALRVARAAHRLATSSQSICAIAVHVGFADQSHLCRAFRTELGVSPSAYRTLMRR